jgi:hypothetical protein
MTNVLSQLNRVWQQVEAFNWDAQAWSQQERKSLHTGLCKWVPCFPMLPACNPQRTMLTVLLAAVLVQQYCLPAEVPYMHAVADASTKRQQEWHQLNLPELLLTLLT